MEAASKYGLPVLCICVSVLKEVPCMVLPSAHSQNIDYSLISLSNQAGQTCTVVHSKVISLRIEYFHF